MSCEQAIYQAGIARIYGICINRVWWLGPGGTILLDCNCIIANFNSWSATMRKASQLKVKANEDIRTNCEVPLSTHVQLRSKRKCVCKCMPLYRFASTRIKVAVTIIAGHNELHLRRRHCLLTSSALTSSRVRSCLASPETARRTAITARRLKRWDIMVANWLRLVDEWSSWL